MHMGDDDEDDDPADAIGPGAYGLHGTGTSARQAAKKISATATVGDADDDDDEVESVGEPYDAPSAGRGPTHGSGRHCITCGKPFVVGKKRGDANHPYYGQYCEEHDARGEGAWHDHEDHRQVSDEWPKTTYQDRQSE